MNDIILDKLSSSLKEFMFSLASPLQDSLDDMSVFEADTIERTKYNGQKIILQAALNKIFGITVSPFIIVETNNDPAVALYFFEPSELSPVYFSEVPESDPQYFFEPGEIPAVYYDFQIKIPVGIWTAELERQVSAQATLYKLAGKVFQIITY
jgi:hypothetical protein